MRDTVKINKVDATHYEIIRTLTDKVNTANLEDQLNNLNIQIETLNDQLEALHINKKTIEDALAIESEGGAIEGTAKVVNLVEEKKPSPHHKHKK